MRTKKIIRFQQESAADRNPKEETQKKIRKAFFMCDHVWVINAQQQAARRVM